MFTTLSAPTSAHIRPFLNQIGSHARLIHRICIPFPIFDYPQPARATRHKAHIENLGLIRDSCSRTQTLELLVLPKHCNYVLNYYAIAVELSNLLDMRLKDIPVRNVDTLAAVNH